MAKNTRPMTVEEILQWNRTHKNKKSIGAMQTRASTGPAKRARSQQRRGPAKVKKQVPEIVKESAKKKAEENQVLAPTAPVEIEQDARDIESGDELMIEALAAREKLKETRERNSSKHPYVSELINERLKAVAERSVSRGAHIVSKHDPLNSEKLNHEIMNLQMGRPLCYSEIARIMGMTKTAIVQRASELGGMDLQAFQKHEADIYDFLRLRMVRSILNMSEERFSKLTESRVAPLWFNSWFNNARLVRNLSTANNFQFSLVWFGNPQPTRD